MVRIKGMNTFSLSSMKTVFRYQTLVIRTQKVTLGTQVEVYTENKLHKTKTEATKSLSEFKKERSLEGYCTINENTLVNDADGVVLNCMIARVRKPV